MSRFRPCLLPACFLAVALASSIRSEPAPAAEVKKAKEVRKPIPIAQRDADEINRLIQQLGSSVFAEREAANKRLENIGEPALDALRREQANSSDAEVRSRAGQLIQNISERVFDKLFVKMNKEGVKPDKIFEMMSQKGAPREKIFEKMFKEGVRHETETKDFKKAFEFLDLVKKESVQQWIAENRRGENPFISEVCVHLARTCRKLEEYEKAAEAYKWAVYFSSSTQDNRKQIEVELSEMTDALISGWEKIIKHKIDKDPALKNLVAKYPLVILHSRRYTGGGYLKCAYSFTNETVDQEKHGNYVELLFDNGRRESTFDINMLGTAKK